MKKIRFILRRLYRDKLYRISRKLRRWINRILYKPIYYSYWSRDCDMCEAAGVDVWTEGEKAFAAYWERRAEWADGPFGYELITREEYEQQKDQRYFRDRCMEAYENGNGTSIYV